MKNKSLFENGVLFESSIIIIMILFFTFQINVSNAQWDMQGGGGVNTTNGISRWGGVGVGMTASYIPNYPLHVITPNATGLKLVSTGSGVGSQIGIDFITYNPGASYDHRTARICVFDGGSFNGSMAFFTRPTNTSGSNSVVERMRITDAGLVGIGTGTPTRLLHLKGTSSLSLFLDGDAGGTQTKVEFGNGGNPIYEMYYYKYGFCGDGRFKIGAVGDTKKSIHFLTQSNNGVTYPSGKIVFSTNALFGYGSCTGGVMGLSGAYLFDDQVSSTSLLVAPATLTLPYPSIPSGYIFNVQGNSSLNGQVQVSNSTDIDPVNSVSGLSLGVNTNTSVGATTAIPFSWIQTEDAKPLALNPIVNSNPTTVNTSYVAIGFVPGSLNVPLNYKLAVKGKIICEELKVKYSGTWSDYVFAKEYKLRELSEVEQYIETNKHLPDVPSAKEVEENGFESGEMNATLLRKIEELTLYMIKMEKEQSQVNKKIKELDEENKRLRELLLSK